MTATVLLVEDESQVRELHVTMLRTLGYQVLEAADGEEAFHLAANTTGPIHILVTDVIMPELSGHDLARRVSELRPGIKVLFMSGYTDDAIAQHGVLEQAEILIEPAELGQLLPHAGVPAVSVGERDDPVDRVAVGQPVAVRRPQHLLLLREGEVHLGRS